MGKYDAEAIPMQASEMSYVARAGVNAAQS
jgi:hypothetical protein